MAMDERRRAEWDGAVMTKDQTSTWNLESLNKAYRQGYMAGFMGMSAERCPYRGDIVVAAWEAGWEDGRLAHQENAARPQRHYA